VTWKPPSTPNLNHACFSFFKPLLCTDLKHSSNVGGLSRPTETHRRTRCRDQPILAIGNRNHLLLAAVCCRPDDPDASPPDGDGLVIIYGFSQLPCDRSIRVSAPSDGASWGGSPPDALPGRGTRCGMTSRLCGAKALFVLFVISRPDPLRGSLLLRHGVGSEARRHAPTARGSSCRPGTISCGFRNASRGFAPLVQGAKALPGAFRRFSPPHKPRSLGLRLQSRGSRDFGRENWRLQGVGFALTHPLSSPNFSSLRRSGADSEWFGVGC